MALVHVYVMLIDRPAVWVGYLLVVSSDLYLLVTFQVLKVRCSLWR